MDNQPPHTERGLRSRQEEALRLMRRAQWAAYFQCGVCVVVYVGFAIAGSDWLSPLFYAGLAILLGALGYLVGRRHSAAAAAALVVLVLGTAVLQWIGGGRPPALLFVAIFAWFYGQAFSAAREFAALKSVLLDISAGAT